MRQTACLLVHFARASTLRRSGAISASTWSPDGKLVAATVFGSSIKKGSSIVTTDVATGKLTTIRTQRKAYLYNLSWQPLPPGPAPAPAG